jgi:nitrite reductase (NO-forming)
MGAALIAAAPLVIKTAGAEEVMDTSAAAPVDLSSLPRRKLKLVKPPFVHLFR